MHVSDIKNWILFRSANARYLFAGQLLSQVFDRVTSLGLIWTLSSQFSAAAVSWYLVCAALPHLLLSAYSGPWINRIGVRRTLIITDLARALLFFAAAALAANGAFSSMASFMALIFISNIFASLFNPAILSIPPQLATQSDARQITALLTTCGNLALVIGPTLMALLSRRLPLAAIFAITAAAYVLAALASIAVTVAGGERSAGAPADAPAASGTFTVLRAYPLIGSMLLSFLFMNLLIGPSQLILASYAKDVFARSIDGLAGLESALGMGMIAGTVALTFFQAPKSILKGISLGLIFCAVCYLLFTLSHEFFLGLAAIALFGFFLGTSNIWIINLFQEYPTAADVPVVMAMTNLISISVLPISLSVTGLIVASVPVRTLAIASAAGLLAVTLITAARLGRSGEVRT